MIHIPSLRALRKTSAPLRLHFAAKQPPLAVQREIAAAIEAERTAVDACWGLAVQYEERIRKAVEEVWE